MPEKLIIRRPQAENASQSVMQLSGPLTLATLFDFQDLVRKDAADSLIIDLTDVPFVDSAGIGCLVNAHVSRIKSGRQLALVGVADRVTTTLKVTGVLKVLAMFPTMDAALASVDLGSGSPPA